MAEWFAITTKNHNINVTITKQTILFSIQTHYIQEREVHTNIAK